MTKKRTKKDSGDFTNPNSPNSGLRNPNIRFAFFGTPQLAAVFLDELKKAALVPSLVVTAPDRRQGRGLVLAPPPVKKWAQARGIEVLQPEELHSHIPKYMRVSTYDVFIVAAYGKLLPKALLALPRRGALNVHPSLLPRLRGASPARSAILHDERNTGVSILLLDEKMDHGPLVAQKKVVISDWPARAGELEETLMREGAKLLAQILPQWVGGQIEARAQNDDVATYCEKIKKEDGLLDLSADAYKNLLKIRAFEGWPGAHAFFERNAKKIRAGILDAHLDPSNSLGASKLVIDRVKPEGKREMSYEEFLRSGARPI